MATSDDRETRLLIVGAGPFGLAAAARAIALGLEHVVVGRPMSFWRENMPKGMFLRSGFDWHLDPQGMRTFERYLAVHGLPKSLPIALEPFLDYAEWFRRECGIRIDERFVHSVERNARGRFVAHLEDGARVIASAVLCAPGFRPFRHVPAELTASVPAGRVFHSADLADLGRFAGRRCLIVGGRQSAFETAALLAEGGAKSVSVIHRHATPAFEESDWSWVAGDLVNAKSHPGWFASLPPESRRSIERRFWAEGRLKLEPWLGDRLRGTDVSVVPNTSVEDLRETADGSLCTTLQGEAMGRLHVDDVILATGFKVDVSRIDYLRELVPFIECEDGFPSLTSTFECRGVPGLYLTGLVAARQFGPYMGFLASCPFAARTAVDAVAAALCR